MISVMQVERVRLKKIQGNKKNANKVQKESWVRDLSQQDSFVEICLERYCVYIWKAILK